MMTGWLSGIGAYKLHVWWAGGGGKDLSSEHRRGLNGTEIGLWLVF